MGKIGVGVVVADSSVMGPMPGLFRRSRKQPWWGCPMPTRPPGQGSQEIFRRPQCLSRLPRSAQKPGHQGGRGLRSHSVSRPGGPGGHRSRKTCNLRNAPGRQHGRRQQDHRRRQESGGGPHAQPDLPFHPQLCEGQGIDQGRQTRRGHGRSVPGVYSAKVLADQWPASSWMWKFKESGGPLFTLAVWSIDLFRWLLESEITKVHPATKYTVLEQFGKTTGYDSCTSVQFANGVVGNFQYSGTVCNTAANSTLEVVGSSTAMIQATNNDMIRLFADNPPQTEWNVKQEGAKVWGHYQQDQHFVRCLLEGKKPCISPEDGIKAMEIGLEIGLVK